jgi:serine protease Do
MYDDGTKQRLGIWPYVFGSILGVSLALIIVSGLLFYRAARVDDTVRLPEPTAAWNQGTAAGSIDQGRQNAIVEATKRVAPAVVSVTATFRRRKAFSSEAQRRFWEHYFPGISGAPPSLGSGVIINPDGYILTNDHVISNVFDDGRRLLREMAERILVTLSNGETVEAELVVTADDYDLALLKVTGENLPYAPLGNSGNLVVGEWVIAIGQPFGQLLHDTQPTVTVGVVSALHRDIRDNRSSDKTYKDMIQTDAAINPGNSGGPLVNSRGEVIGINTFIFSTTGGSLGIGFAIPSDRGEWVLKEFQDFGRVREPWLGFKAWDLKPQLAVSLGLKSRRGLVVGEIHHESPAEKAGFKPGDLIVEVNGVTVTSTAMANHIIFGARIGDMITFKIERDRKMRTIEVQLEERPDEI